MYSNDVSHIRVVLVSVSVFQLRDFDKAMNQLTGPVRLQSVVASAAVSGSFNAGEAAVPLTQINAVYPVSPSCAKMFDRTGEIIRRAVELDNLIRGGRPPAQPEGMPPPAQPEIMPPPAPPPHF